MLRRDISLLESHQQAVLSVNDIYVVKPTENSNHGIVVASKIPTIPVGVYCVSISDILVSTLTQSDIDTMMLGRCTTYGIFRTEEKMAEYTAKLARQAAKREALLNATEFTAEKHKFRRRSDTAPQPPRKKLATESAIALSTQITSSASDRIKSGRFKINSIAQAQDISRRHVFSIATVNATATATSKALTTAILSPSGRRMTVFQPARTSQAQSRIKSIDECDARVEASRQRRIASQRAGQRRRASLKEKKKETQGEKN